MTKLYKLLLSKQIAPETAEFLAATQSAAELHPDALRQPVRDVLTACNAAVAKLLVLRSAYDEVRLSEPDDEVLGVLYEYQMKMGAFEREINKLREASTELSNIMREFQELEARTGEPLRTDPNGA